MRNYKRNKMFTSPSIKALVVFIFCMFISQFLAYRIFISEKAKEFKEVEHETLLIKNLLENSLNHSVTATKMLGFILDNDLMQNNFDSISADILQQNKFIDAIQLVEGRKIVKTYPLKGNEETIGYSVLHDSAHRSEAFKAYERRELYFEGPFNLRQGGVGIVGRLPLFKKDTLWGFSAVVIRIETILKALNLDSTGKNGSYVYQIVKYHGDKTTKTNFFQNEEDFTSGVFHETFIPLGDWHVFVKLKKSTYLKNAMFVSIIGMAFSLLLTFYLLHLFVQPSILKRMVREKTKNIESVNVVLEKKAAELMVSNKELEQFAYVVSHDLQEPLRMITGFLAQLEKKYENQLDDKAKQYIHYAVDGSKRMRQIILDLLQFSKIGRTEEDMVTIDPNELIDDFCSLRRKIIQEKSAIINYSSLPEVTYYKAPLIQIFHNLIDNALKYSRVGVKPEITIAAVDKGEFREFSVKDNGIGIQKEYFDKIFLIFQRLHTINEFSGTGLGLAIVKKIIENNGGKIWVESEEGVGTTFYFTIKK